jgi:antitoxin MazE
MVMSLDCLLDVERWFVPIDASYYAQVVLAIELNWSKEGPMQDGQIKESAARVVKVGDELAVRLPADAIAKLALKEGDELEVREHDGHLILERKSTADELFERVRQMPWRIPANYKFDRDDANARGPDDAS